MRARSPTGLSQFIRTCTESDLERILMGNGGLQTAVRLHYGQILQNIVHAGILWSPALRHEMDTHAALR